MSSEGNVVALCGRIAGSPVRSSNGRPCLPEVPASGRLIVALGFPIRTALAAVRLAARMHPSRRPVFAVLRRRPTTASS